MYLTWFTKYTDEILYPTLNFVNWPMQIALKFEILKISQVCNFQLFNIKYFF